MTVSPKWPDEGKKPPFQEGNLDSAQPVGPPVALPPTLFQLPNLRADRTTDAKRTEIPDSASTLERHNFGQQVAEMPFSSARYDGAVAAPTPTIQPTANATQSGRGDDDEPRFPTPPAVMGGIATPATDESAGVNRESISRYGGNNQSPETKGTATPPPTDRPAGRSWMDSIGSHGIVVALLLVVVAAALYTGRAGKDDADDASLADGRDWLEYNADEEISLPKAAMEAGSSGVTLAESNRGAQDAQDPTGQYAIASSSETGTGGTPSDKDLSTSNAVLSRPVASDSFSGSQSTTAEHLPRNLSDSFQQPHASIVAPVSPAATRKDEPRGQANPPRQTGQPAAYGISVPATQTPTYRRTATPSGIADWSKYFPRVPSGSTVSPTNPSPSN